MPGPQLEKVAARLVVDGAYRERCRQGLQEAVTAGGGGVVDVLGRVRRLNEYLATGLVLDDDGADEGGAVSGSSLSPLPWQPPQQQQPKSVPQSAAAAASLPPPQTESASSESESDSDIEEEGGEVQEEGKGLAGLLAAAQAAVERRRGEAALSIQCAYRRHRACQQVLQMRMQRQASSRLVARVIAGAYQRVCGGQQRRLPRQALVGRLRAWRRWRRRAQRQQRRRQEQQLAAAAAATAAAKQTVQPGQQQQQQQQQRQGSPQPQQQGQPDVNTELTAAAASVAGQIVRCSLSGATPEAASSSFVDAPAPPASAHYAAAPHPPPSSPPVAAPVPQQGHVKQVSTPAAVRPAFPPLDIPAPQENVSSQDGSLGPQKSPVAPLQQQQQQHQQLGCLQHCLAAPPPQPRPGTCLTTKRTTTSSSSPRTSTPASCAGWDSPPRSAGSASGCGATPPDSAGARPGAAGGARAGAGAGAGAGSVYRRLSSIQLLESVQLGVDHVAGTVASQAALEVCERVQERVAGLQRSASGGQRSGGGAAGPSRRSISRVGSAVQRQASRTGGWGLGADAIQE